MTAPSAGIVAPGQSRKLYVVDQGGRLKELDIDAARLVTRLRTVLDVSSVLVGRPDPEGDGE